ncbi:hypothetical protein GCM10010411_45540 [Actinomadura fulvescens]|uniref:DUF8094 domain-containing protein n=1 Tax=Actinomadura fulvescens TaxID=46160 RepID=A0ABN3Q147_9ACTN
MKGVLTRFAARSNLLHRTLDRRTAATAYTGSSLQMELAKYRVFKANRVRFQQARYGAIVGATPKFSAHPKWFFAAMTDRGTRPAVRDIVVFVQDKPGGPWLAAYTPLATKPVSGPLVPGIDVADVPDVVPPGDPSLAMPPVQVSAALADVINQGGRSPHLRAFAVPAWAKTKRTSLMSDRKTFRSLGWRGEASYSASQAPVYAVRTKSGGALVWTAVELKEDFRRAGGGRGVTWKHSTWGDLFKPFTGRSSMKKAITTVERIEVLAYVPPRGRGKVRFLANRWAPIAITGN